MQPQPSAATLRFREIMAAERAKRLTGRQMLDRYFRVEPDAPRVTGERKRFKRMTAWLFSDGIQVSAYTKGEARAVRKRAMPSLPPGLACKKMVWNPPATMAEHKKTYRLKSGRLLALAPGAEA